MLLLQRAGLNPNQLDHPGPMLRYISLWTLKVRVTVPAGQEDRAREILDEMTQQQSRSVEKIDREIRRHFVIAAVVFFAILLGYYLYDQNITMGRAFLSGVVAMGSMVLWSRLSTKDRTK
jgi:hypothetical protein